MLCHAMLVWFTSGIGLIPSQQFLLFFCIILYFHYKLFALFCCQNNSFLLLFTLVNYVFKPPHVETIENTYMGTVLCCLYCHLSTSFIMEFNHLCGVICLWWDCPLYLPSLGMGGRVFILYSLSRQCFIFTEKPCRQ